MQARRSAVRGDLDGDGRRDELALTTAGTLVYLPGRADGTLATAVSVSGDFSWIDWIGSPGDMNRDGYQDMLVRDKRNGDLLYYAGDGRGGFTGSRRIGTGWGQMDPNKFFPITSFTYGATSILAVNTTNCYLYRYDFGSDGTTITRSAVIGTGWCGMKSIFSNGDTNGDGISDVVGITTGGDYLVYSGLGTGVTTGGYLRTGWGWNFAKVTAPGDATGDGYGDVLALTTDGTLYQYPTGPNNTWQAKQTVLTGFFTGYRLME